MAALLNLETGQQHRVSARSLVGRSARSDIRLSGVSSSNDHATIGWDGACWSLKDLSRNGTRVNDILLINGQRCRLQVGDVIIFGDPAERWRWLDGTAPQPAATCRELELRVESADGIILLPSEEAPQASVCSTGDRWVLDMNGTVRSVEDGALVKIGALSFQLELPCIDPDASTTRTYQHELSITRTKIQFRVSRDEEFVTVEFALGPTVTQLRPRGFHYMLLLLARARLQDLASGLPDSESGWVHADELARQRKVSIEDINVDICRARKQVAQQCGFVDAACIVERRNGTGQLRLGVAAIGIETPADGM